MEHWEAIVERPLEQCHRSFEKVLETASALLNTSSTQLAPFETEWLVQTLLYRPVEVLATVSRRRGEDAWRKAVADALRLLARVADLCEHRHYEHIVDVCLLSYDPELRKHALACVAAVARRSDAGARDAARHVQALEEAGQCRAPIALLVGALCEHHPAVVCDEVTRVWRGYLNMLDNTKITDAVTKAALEGICGLLKNFGDELPCLELAQFYDNLTSVYINKTGCPSVCYSILAGHAALFKERVSTDRALRLLLWGAAPEAALLSVYTVTAQCVDRTALVKILTTEVLPHTQSPSYQTKLAALRVLAATKTGSFGDLSQYVDVHALEYELRREKVSHADAETVLWCVEYNLPNSERLLQAAILFYDNLPHAVRKKIVTGGILNSPPELKRAAIQFLIARACEDEDAKVWRDIFDDHQAAGTVVRELADCLVVALEAVEHDIQELPPKLSALLRLASLVPPPHAAALRVCASPLRTLASHASALQAAGTLLAGACGGDDFYKSIRIDRCRDEATVHAACLALAQAPRDVQVDPENMLGALQIIFSSDAEPGIHGAALRKFDELLTNDKCVELDTRHAMRAVEKLRARGDRTDRDVRILHRELTMFLGKHGSVYTNNNRDSWDDAIIVDLKKSLALTLPYQGASYKVDLKTMLLLTLRHEDPSALLTFLTMLCADLSSNKELNTQRAVTRVLCALAHAHASGGGAYAEHIQRAVRMCGDGTDLLQYISSSKSCGARKLLGGALGALCEQPEALRGAAGRACVMLASADSTTRRAGLDIAETILTCLENNHSLCRTILPELSVLIAKTYETDTKAIFDIASKSFVDKKELFDSDTIRKTINSLVENLLKTNLSDVKIYKVTVKMTIEFVRNLRDVKLDELILDISKNDVNVKTLYVLAVLKSEFGFDSENSRKILGRDNLAVINSLLNLDLDETGTEFFNVEVTLRFLEEYCEVILELKYKETLQFISELVAKLTPASIKHLHKNIKLCFASLNRHWTDLPKTITSSVQNWVEMLPIKKITDAIERENFLTEHHLCVGALKIMSNVFDMRQINLSDVKMCMSKWPRALLKLYMSGRLEEYFYDELTYFNEILTVSLKHLTLADVKKILNTNTGSFCAFFVEGFFEVLTEKPFILLDEELKGCSVVLNDIVRLVVKKTSLKERYENVLELMDKIWPTYEQHATFVQKHCLLANLKCLGAAPDSNPLQWATRVVCSKEAPLEERVKLLAFVPEENFKSPEVFSAVCSLFPARLRELSPALLEASADTPAALLPTLAALAANDSSTGWWDVALESCLASVAKKNNLDICVTLFHKCHSERACERVLVPLLRHSSTEVCERFLASALDRILGSLRKGPRGAKGDTVDTVSQKLWGEYMISVHMLLIAFEKLPTSSLESPSSVLYGGSSVQPWHLVREACKLCHSLRGSRCSDQQMHRKLQCMLYNCMCAAICRRRPPLPLYSGLLTTDALSNIVDDQELVLPIRASWCQRSKTLPVAVPLGPSTLSPSHTQRSRIFLRTLSEDPMLFDLHSSEEEVMEVQDISLRETPLNAHACAGTLTALFRHVTGVPSLASLWSALACLLRDAGDNLKWLLAQIICNCKEELKPQASVLLPGLLAVLASVEDGKCMNGLHVDVLDTILYWKEPITSDDLHTITHHLVTTCMENPRRAVFDGLLKTLYGWLELYGTVRVEWTSFEKYYQDQHKDTQNALFRLIKTILKTKIYIPRILSKIVAKLDTNPAMLAECFGLAIAACQDAGEKGEALGEFKKYLEKCNVITNYVRVMHYSSLGAAECCGEQEFRKIADYVTKVTSSDRTKCLHILSAFLSRGRRSGYVGDMFDTIHLAEMIDKDHAALSLVKNGLPLMSETMRRRCVAQISALRPAAPKVKGLAVAVMLQAYKELFSQPPQPPAKRQKTEATPILSVSRDDVHTNSVLTCLGMYAVDSDVDVAGAARDGLGASLDKELGARFVECFLLTLYLPAHTDRTLDLCVCVSALLEMLFSGLRASEGFKGLRLREEPLPDIQEVDSRLLTLSKTFQGTFGSYSATRGRMRRPQGSSGTTLGTDTTKPVIDVQMPIDSILETLLEFAKTTPEAARALLSEVLRSVLTSSKFDVATTLVPLLGTLLGREPTDLTPLYIDVARLLVGSNVQSLLAPAGRLRALAAGTEGADLVQLLYEEVAMKCMGDEMFLLGQPGDIQDVVMDGTATFSIEDLKSAFGKLSNWEELTLQQRRATVTSLPTLWTERRDFVSHLDSYQVPENAECWFDKMAAICKQQSVDSWRWLLKADQWPRRHFDISAITEALSWRHEPSEAPSHLFNTSDCLAESAARLMIRSSYYASLQHSETDEKINMLSRSHELKWCMRANEMGIPSAVLQCVERNVEELRDGETLAWLRQKLVALRQVALTRRDTALLRDVLAKAEKYTPQFSSDPTVCIEMYQLMLQLHTDLESLSHHKLQSLLAEVHRSSQQVDWKTCSQEAVSSVFQTAMAYYDEALDTGSMDAESALSNMSRVVCRAAALDTPATDLLLAVLLNRAGGFQGRLGAESDLRQLTPLLPTLDSFTLELLEKNSSKLPGLEAALSAQPRASAHKYTRCLQLVCDPGHLLTRCCEDLVHALRDKDAARWKSTMDRMKDKIYANPYAGPSYKLLDKYKEDLYGMSEYESTPEFASRAEAKLKSIIISARRDPQSTLRLSDLCPSLLGPLEGSGVEKLFGLQRVKIVKFYDKVQVFTDSIRRPVVVSMLLSTGHTRRAIQKTGEPLARDAAAQRVAARCARGAAYSVILLDEESALIEYLEGHERLRTMIASTCNLDAAQAAARPADGGLTRSAAASLRAHHESCALVPAHALRSAMEQASSCVQDFISKKHNFTESLADMTLLTWLLGLGDRHLQNILCGRDGRVRSVDWGDVWRRAASPPARLTRNLLAVSNMQVLEARLQSSLASMRGSALLLQACARAAFHWMGPDLNEQMQHVSGILRGTATSYDVTRDVTSRSSLKHKEKYLSILDGVLGDSRSDSYSVEDQVTCLLRHCTSPALLSVTRAGWEPWV